jgi:hypothetical protein
MSVGIFFLNYYSIIYELFNIKNRCVRTQINIGQKC